jgi:carbon-monoxide dehydrogenase large subunit
MVAVVHEVSHAASPAIAPVAGGRLEDERLLKGQGRFAADWELPGQLHAVFVRADRPHAEIVRVGKEEALARPGVVAVLTGADVAAAGYGSLPTALAFPDRFGQPLKKPHRPALAQARVRYVGECVACVVAESPLIAQDAADLVRIEYRDLPAVVWAEESLQQSAPQLHENVPGNLYLDYGSGDAEKTDAAFAAAKRIVRLRLHNTRVVANPMEPRACMGAYDARRSHYTLHACTQGAYGMRGQLVQALGVADDRIDIVAQDVGGGFGVRFNCYPEYCSVLLAAKLTGRPVKWTGTRSEVFLADEHSRDVASFGELALDDSGRFLGLRFSFIANLGAYLTQTGPFISTKGTTNCLAGVYDVQAAWARIQLVATNTPPVAAYRGAGRPTMAYMLERLVDQAAWELSMDPAELRRRNLIRREQFPYRTVNGSVYDCGDFGGVMDDALAIADWANFERRRTESARRGRLRGRGVATYIEATGAGNAPADEVELRWEPDGRLVLHAASHSQGQSHETTYAQIVAGVLGIAVQSVSLRSGDPQVRVIGNPAGGSRSILAVGSVMQHAAKQVVRKGLALAADRLEAAPADLEFVDGAYHIRGTDRRIRLIELVKLHAGGDSHPLDVRTQLKIGSTFPNGCHVAEIELDPETGHAEIVRYTAVDDIGNVINHWVVEGQMHGGLAQGAGQVFGEVAVYDRDSGQLLTGSFMDYPMPRAGILNHLTIQDHPVPTSINSLGAKGVGEAGVTGSLPTLMNAVMDALRTRGVSHFDMPASPQRIWAALNGRGGA